jgi:hypothetical protein
MLPPLVAQEETPEAAAAVQNSPEFDPSRPVSGDYESVLYDHYGRPRSETKSKP